MTPTTFPPISQDRLPALGQTCDRCSARAKLHCEFAGGGGLDFCGHHANSYAGTISRQSVRILVAEDFDWLSDRIPELAMERAVAEAVEIISEHDTERRTD